MQLSHKKRLDIFIEAHSLAPVEALLSKCGFKGWTVLEGVEGSGAHGAWRQTGIGEQAAYLVVAIGAEAAAEAALAELSAYFTDYPGIVTITDVTVVRGERF
ncbi:MAG: DUF190 domain-containing protein [Hyphomonadaceae bacterium]